MKRYTIKEISILIKKDGFASWKLHLFNFVDYFRRNPSKELISEHPVRDIDQKLKALLASTVMALCLEKGMEVPNWAYNEPYLKKPWFVSGYENLKVAALVESPLAFKIKNIFVLGNFLNRA